MIFKHSFSLENWGNGASNKQVRDFVKELRRGHKALIEIDSLSDGFVRTNDDNVAMVLKLFL